MNELHTDKNTTNLIPSPQQALPGIEVDDPLAFDTSHKEELALFEHLIAQQDIPWAPQFEELVSQGYVWRKAATIAWLCVPKKDRMPKTQQELAEMLGCSTNVVRRYSKQADAQMLALVSRSFLLANLADVDQALVEVASDPNYKSVRGMELFYKRAGLLVDTLNMNVSRDADPTDLSDEELERLAGLGAGDD